MKPVTLPDMIALNERLAAMAAADLPLDRELTRSAAALPITLAAANAAVSRRMADGQTIEQSLAAEERLTPAYRLLLQVSANSEDRGAALIGPQRLARSADNSSRILQQALVYPLLVCGLAYLGLILFCLYLVPALEQLYLNMRLPAGSALRLLNGLRMTLPYWVAVPPLALCLIVLLCRRQQSTRGHSRGMVAWLPGMQRIIAEQKWSAFADSLANLLAAGLPFDNALHLIADAGNDEKFSREADAIAARMARNEAAAADGSFASVPPFLRWALFRSEPLMNRAAALRLAADLYYESAERRISRMKVAVPIVFSIVLGGSVTFLYALALFVPLSHLLQTIAA